ncbi:AAA family ATPase [Sphingomonas sp. KRR8]|uniref:replicative DNA helicase n=1 Tax=Sphingomonas sp. KRR8 TaxID=2942996 RepID=UPI0020218A69|nr:DnaB-like helicase C-terminal domain-containing protein [Sphingomonas sp. KRR8]URD60470.1 AAA family ATPase [Sphingomonas sp. KRR8]
MPDTDLTNPEAELCVLASALLDPRLLERMVETVSPPDFSEPFFGAIFDLLGKHQARGNPLTPVTLKPLIEGWEAYEQMGGMAWLAGITGSGAAVLAGLASAKQVRELATRRTLVASLHAAATAASDYDAELPDVLVMADEALNAARDQGEERGEYSGAAALDLVLNGFDEPVTGARCRSIPSLDELLGPMRPSHQIVVGARPGMGKTALAISASLGAAEAGHGVLFFSLEMSAEQLAERAAADLCLGQRVPYSSIRDRTLTVEQRRHVCRARERVAEMPLQIVDRQGLRISQIRSLVRRWKRRFEAKGQKLELVVIDYLQLVRPDGKLNAYETVSEVSRSMKEIAKENGLAVLALAQLSREVEKREDKRPQLADLRESGQIEQDADAVLFLLRPEYYLQAAEPAPQDPKRDEWERQMRDAAGLLEIICAKRRNGRTGCRVATFHSTYQAVRG